MNPIERTLEFDAIKEMLQAHAHCEKAKQRIRALSPYLQEEVCLRHTADTSAARNILEAFGSPPLPYMQSLEEWLGLVNAGSMLLPEQIAGIAQFAASCKRVQAYLKKAQSVDTRIAPYGNSLHTLDALYHEIDGCIRCEQVDDKASSTLHSLRRHIESTQAKIKEKLNSLLTGNKAWFSDHYVTERNGRYVLPVKREYKNMLNGSVIELSSSKGTYFMEPTSVGKLQDEINRLRIEEDAEVRRILYTLCARIDEHAPLILANIATMEELDFVFAKAKLSQQMQAVPAQITTERVIHLQQGRHPLLPRDACVPLDFCISGDTRGVIITGPNTGGKTVAMKTVGLLSMMAQCALHIPADPASILCMHASYWCDIGDGQSIAQNLSTFSGHMTNVIHVLQHASSESLVLLDELGSGTDPAEGMGLAIAVLEELRQRGCLFLVTTHYPQVKEYAQKTPGIMEARMAFDKETLCPLYRLEQGQSGESCALYIAERLGLPIHILERARQEAYAVVSARDTLPGLPPPLPSPGPNLSAPMLQPKAQTSTHPSIAAFTIGDSVMVYPQKELGIVYQAADKQGVVGVQIKGVKQQINHKRLKLHVAAKELYPEEYDLSIVLDTVANRKAQHKMAKRHQPGLAVHYEPEH